MDGVFCNNCGHRNPTGANFCSSCGAVLSAVGSDTTVTLHPVDSQGEAGDEELSVTLPDRPTGTGLLVVKRGPSAGSRFVLDAPVTRAGRHPESDIFLDDVTVSRRHVEFTRTASGCTVRDVGSLNGTYVNRERIEEAVLSSGDEVQIGKFKLVYLAAADE
ncbi:MAG TPA: FHA domain-containing protein [Acidimicrobiales bacterium]|nr:FHA domain-containing protein [Acidimicrobiales bacterium]